MQSDVRHAERSGNIKLKILGPSELTILLFLLFLQAGAALHFRLVMVRVTVEALTYGRKSDESFIAIVLWRYNEKFLSSEITNYF